jgi:hypothetical protein
MLCEPSDPILGRQPGRPYANFSQTAAAFSEGDPPFLGPPTQHGVPHFQEPVENLIEQTRRDSTGQLRRISWRQSLQCGVRQDKWTAHPP